MTRALITCDGAAVPRDLQKQHWDYEPSILRRGAKANLTLRLQNISHTLRAEVDGLAADLVRLAAYVYAADQEVSRGGLRDWTGEGWRREFHLCVAVTDPDFWAERNLRSLLGEMLNFVSDDDWTFHFSACGPEERQLPFESPAVAPVGEVDAVVLFSGGVDSLCAAVEQVVDHRHKPILVSHRSASFIDHRQHDLIKALRRNLPQEFPYTSVWANRIGSKPKASTQRTRSFLYASLGVAVAEALEVKEVILADNGVVSINLPINKQALGALRTRSTHPKFIDLFNQLAASALEIKPVVSNTLRFRTRPECLGILKLAGLTELVPLTNSCAASRGLNNATPHCGTCSQCIDRRMATISSGLEALDPATGYVRDALFGELPQGPPRVMAHSYIRFARDVHELSVGEFIHQYPDFEECILESDPAPQETAEALYDMLQRHATSVLGVVASQVASSSAEIAEGTLSPNCLIALCLPQNEPIEVLFTSPVLTSEQEGEFAKHRFKSRVLIVLTGTTEGRAGNIVKLDQAEAYVPDAEFALFLRLVISLLAKDDGYVTASALQAAQDASSRTSSANAIEQYIDRLRGRFRGRIGKVKHTEFIEASRARYRLSTHRSLVRWDSEALSQHPNTGIRALASEMDAAVQARTSQH